MPPAQPSSVNPVSQASNSTDYIVLLITFIAFFIGTSIYFIISYFTDEAVMKDGASIVGFLFALTGGLVIFVGFLLFGMFLVRMQRQMMLGNALQVEYSDYAWLREWSKQVSTDFKMPEVEIYITQDPTINAYAYGFIRPYNIVLHSGTIRYLTKEELKVVVAHEMGHIKYGHTIASVYLQPFTALPIIGVVAGWVAGFWERRCELTADRLALMYTRNPELVKRSLIKVHVGPDAAKYLNQVAEQWLHHKADRPMNRFAQTFSSHPFLVRRLGHIDRQAATMHPHSAAPLQHPTMLQ